MSSDALAASRMTARKILAQCHNNIVEIVGRLDHLEEGIVNTSDLKHALEGQKINDVGADELDALLKGCDRGQKGYISTNKFIDTLYSMGAETESEVILRRLSKTLSHSGADLQQAMRRYDTQGTGRIDKTAFKKCLKALSVAMTDPEIQKLTQDPGQAGGAREPGRKGVQEEEKQQYGAPSTLPTYVDIEKFTRQVNEAGRIKPLPNYVLQGPKGSRSAGATRPGGGGGNSMGAFEAEKKYKKNLEALKTEIEEKNREIEGLRKEVKDCHDRYNRLDHEKKNLEARLVDKHSKPPRETQNESLAYGQAQEVMSLKEQLCHQQDENTKLRKTIAVVYKAEISRLSVEKEQATEKLNDARDEKARLAH